MFKRLITVGLKQIINQPIHIHSNCHHQIMYVRFNLKIYYSHLYEREIWHYKKSEIDLIQQAIREFNWERAFHRKNINE